MTSRLPRALLYALAGLAFGALVGAKESRGHDPYTDFRNPITGASCCNSGDCKPVEAREIGEAGDSYTWQGSYFPKRQSQPSPDERYHVCAYREWHLGTQEPRWQIRCLLRPSPGA